MKNYDRRYRVKFCDYKNRLFLEERGARIFCAAMNGELYHWEQNAIGFWNWVRMDAAL